MTKAHLYISTYVSGPFQSALSFATPVGVHHGTHLSIASAHSRFHHFHFSTRFNQSLDDYRMLVNHETLCLWLAILFPWQGDLPPTLSQIEKLEPQRFTNRHNFVQGSAQTDRYRTAVGQNLSSVPRAPVHLSEKYATTGS